MGWFTRRTKTSALPFLERLPGIGDVVWATVARLASANGPARVLFTAVEPRAGTSVLAAATAVGLAQHQRVPVCLLETNVVRPALGDYLGLPSTGLTDVLDGRAELEDCLHELHGCPDLAVLHAGRARAPVTGELATERMHATLKRLAERCRYLVLDAAPVLEHVESRLLLRQVDAALLVLRARTTRRRDAERALDILVESGTPVLGSIFNAYRAEGLWSGNGRANRSYKRAVRAAGTGAPAPVEPEEPQHTLDARAPATNGSAAVDAAAAALTAAEHRRQIDILERRIAKLTHLLEQTESDLQRTAAMKEVDPGLPSIYRGVQGLSSEGEAQAFKRSLMQEIFQANMELKLALARHP